MSDKTLHDAAQEYLEHLKARGKSPRTLYTYQKDLDQIEAHFGKEKKLAAILTMHVSGFLKSDALRKLPSGKDRAKPTVDKTIRVFRMLLVWAKDQGYITRLPFPKDLPLGHNAPKESEVQDVHDSLA